LFHRRQLRHPPTASRRVSADPALVITVRP
jgi:hypothetical protein